MTRAEMSDLRVLMVSTSYPADKFDWQGRFIADMVEAVSRQNIHVSLWAPPGDLPSKVENATSENDKECLRKLLAHGGIAHLLRHRPLSGFLSAINLVRRLSRLYKREPADVIHVNWLQNAIPLWRTKTPALITVLGSDLYFLKLPFMVTLIRKALAGRAVIISPNAAWMRPKLEAHFGDIAEIRPIPFGVDDRWFELKRQFNVPHKWLAVTRITPNKIGDLFAWGEGIFGADRELHLFGPMQEEMPLPGWVIWHGPTNPDELAQDWFPTATGLITLSRHSEGRPQVILEAMAAALPVIASEMDAHKDVIENNVTGWLVDSRESLIKAIEQAEIEEINVRLGLNAKAYIQKKIGTWDKCATRYVEAYNKLAPNNHDE